MEVLSLHRTITALTSATHDLLSNQVKLLRLTAFSLALMSSAAVAEVSKPSAMITDGVPALPSELRTDAKPYLEYRSASFFGWHGKARVIIIGTRFGNVTQVHQVAAPLGARSQLSFEDDEIVGATYALSGDLLVVQKDVGGSEFWQIYALSNGRLTLLTDGKSRNIINGWSPDGRWLAYTSTRRTGADNDLYLVDPRDPKSDRLVAKLTGGDWSLAAFAPDGRTAILANRTSTSRTELASVDLATGRVTAIPTQSRNEVAYGDIRFGPDGKLWVTSDANADFKRLGLLDLRDGTFTAISTEPRWDVEAFDVSPDGSFIAYSVNEAGISRVKLLDPRTRQTRLVTDLPSGVVAFSTVPAGPGGLKIAPSGEIGLSMSSAKSPADVYSINPKTLAVTRWTASETGGLNTGMNVEPELVSIRSFDGEMVSGLLYRPNAASFPGKRPLIMEIHGGPEYQQRPDFRGRTNYFLNELGVAIFYPNVRGSTGYGKRFASLDDGPFKREDSVKDIGAFLDALKSDASIDVTRLGVTGASYGGYMTLASLIAFGDRFKAAMEGVGITNWVTFLENTQAYRRPRRRLEYGDERDPRQRAKLLEISPLSRADRLRQPLLVLVGGNDPRVPPAQAKGIIDAVRKNGGTAWQALAQDEGHRFIKKENVDYFFLTSLLFWKTFLLGDNASELAAAPARPGDR